VNVTEGACPSDFTTQKKKKRNSSPPPAAVSRWFESEPVASRWRPGGVPVASRCKRFHVALEVKQKEIEEEGGGLFLNREASSGAATPVSDGGGRGYFRHLSK